MIIELFFSALFSSHTSVLILIAARFYIPHKAFVKILFISWCCWEKKRTVVIIFKVCNHTIIIIDKESQYSILLCNRSFNFLFSFSVFAALIFILLIYEDLQYVKSQVVLAASRFNKPSIIDSLCYPNSYSRWWSSSQQLSVKLNSTVLGLIDKLPIIDPIRARFSGRILKIGYLKIMISTEWSSKILNFMTGVVLLWCGSFSHIVRMRN